MIQRIHGLHPARGDTPAVQRPSTPPVRPFASVLEEAQSARPLRFSAHAQERMERRGLSLGPAELRRIGDAVDEARSRGAREALILDDGYALIVSVPQRTVITVVAPDNTAPSVFTQIDTAVVLPRAEMGLDGGTETKDSMHGPDPARGGPDVAERQTRRQPLEV